MKTNTLSFRAVLASALCCAWPMLLLAQGNPNPNPDLDAFIAEEMELERLPGVATVIVKDGQIVWLQSYGFADVENNVPVTDSTAFSLASVSKLFVGTAAMLLREDNTISLDDPVNDYLPWSLTIPGFTGSQVTIRQLMTHTSSVIDNFDIMDNYYDYPDPSISLADAMQRYLSSAGVDYDPNNNFLNAAPGTQFDYSNIATALNGYVVELASGQPFDTFCNTEIFDPLCMTRTGWNFTDIDSAHIARPHRFQNGNYIPYPHYGFADYPSGQLRSSVIDLANFMIAFLNGGDFGSTSLLTSSSVEEMLSAQVPTLDDTQGLNWYLEELFHTGGTTFVWGHNGGEMGVSTDLYIDPVNNIGLCVLTNGEGDPIYICDELYDYALTLSGSSGYPPGCLTTSVSEVNGSRGDRELVKVIDYLGREVPMRPNTPLIKIYSDGSVERVIVVE